MEDFFGLDASVIEHAFFVHLSELFLTDFVIEFLIYLPDHQCDFFFVHFIFHAHLI
jgi:hypothetical protein